MVTEGKTSISDSGSIELETTSSLGKGKFLITEGEVEVKASNTVAVREAKMYMKTSTGEEKEVRMTPSQVTEVVAEKLNLKNYSIELTNVEKVENGEEKPVYVVSGKREVKIFGLFKMEMMTKTQINTETEKVEGTHTPWWNFLTRG